MEQREQPLRNVLLIERSTRRAAVSAALLLFLGAACGGRPVVNMWTSVSPASSSPASSCLDDRFPFPAPAATLTAKDTGRTVNLPLGGLVQVTLLGSDAPGGRWPEITVQGEALVALVNPANSATVGTQLAELCAAKPGSATISSGSWQARVDVSS